jgi:hypothetical protein
MKKRYNFSVIGFLVLLTMNSCSVTKCRYSNGWNLGLGRGVEYPGVQVAKSNKAISRNAAKNFNDSLVKEAFANILKSDSAVSSVDNNSFFTAPNYSAQKVQIGNQAIGKDSLKNADKYKKKKSKSRRRYQSNIFDFIPDNEYEYILFLFLIGLIIIGFILWALYSLIRLLVRALRKDKDLPPDTTTVSPNSKDLQVGKDAGSTKEIAQQQVSFEGDTTFDHTNEMNEYTEEELELEEENKSKLLNFLLVGLLTIGLVSLMALGMRNQ